MAAHGREAWRLTVEKIAAEDLQVGDIVVVRPGDRIPSDGEVIDGVSDVDEAPVTGDITIAVGLKAVFLVTTLFGITMLWMAILADTGATVLVTANALRLLAHRSFQ